MTERKAFHRRDALILAGLLLFAAIFALVYNLLFVKPGDVCEIRVDGVLVKTADLSRDGSFALDENPRIHFEVRNGAIAFVESDCPDKICVKSGFLSKSGQSAACLPNGVTIVVTGGDDGLDAVAR